MARKRISEFHAKTLLSQLLNQPYAGIALSAQNPLPEHIQSTSANHYVVKVDQGIKGRFKKGLVLIDQPLDAIPQAIDLLSNKGYSQFLVEPMHTYNADEEKYLAIERTREGLVLSYSPRGGIHIESHPESITKFTLNADTIATIAEQTPLSVHFLEKLIEACTVYYLSFLEINPFIIAKDTYMLLDCAIEVDSTAEFFVNAAWSSADFVNPAINIKTPEELQVSQLAAKSQAAFSLEVLNPDGSIFMMLSGGGASIVLADEVYNQGYGKSLANYGEYSGNPNAEETYLYAKSILSLLLRSRAPKKVLIIAGGVANFTDIRVTFSGLIRALEESKDKLLAQHVSIFVRRGGPYQQEGLAMMNEFLTKQAIPGIVSGPEMVLTDIVSQALLSI